MLVTMFTRTSRSRYAVPGLGPCNCVGYTGQPERAFRHNPVNLINLIIVPKILSIAGGTSDGCLAFGSLLFAQGWMKPGSCVHRKSSTLTLLCVSSAAVRCESPERGVARGRGVLLTRQRRGPFCPPSAVECGRAGGGGFWAWKLSVWWPPSIFRFLFHFVSTLCNAWFHLTSQGYVICSDSQTFGIGKSGNTFSNVPNFAENPQTNCA